jgi:hypothetical protein
MYKRLTDGHAQPHPRMVKAQIVDEMPRAKKEAV